MRKLKLALISNNYSRKITFQKRKNGVMKKVKELSTLCGINACAIIYSPYNSNPEVWPSESGVRRVVSDFQELSEVDQRKKMVDQEIFLKQRIAKASDQLKRQIKENREMEMTEVMFQCLLGRMRMFNLNVVDLNDLGYLIKKFITDLNRRIDILGNSSTEIGESSNDAVVAAAAPSERIGSLAVVAATTTPATVIYEVGSSSSSAAAAAFFNPIQHQHYHQQFRRPAVPHVGLYEQLAILNQSHQQQPFMETMNHPNQRSYVAEHMGFPFMDGNHHNCNHHHHHHNQPQQ